MRYRSRLTFALIISCVLCMVALAKTSPSPPEKTPETLTAFDSSTKHGG